MRFYKRNKEGYRLGDKVRFKTLAWGEKTSLVEFRPEKGKLARPHKHPYEQIGYLVSGRVMFSIENESFEASPGDSWCVPADAEHALEALEDSLLVEVFSPVRAEWLPGG